MKAGLFICDHVNEPVWEVFGDYSDMFTQLLPELDWKFYDVVKGEFPKDLNECDVYFTTGSSRSVLDEEPWVDKLKEIVRKLAKMDKLFVGFCFGHQLMGEALGGKVQKSPKKWSVGIHTFNVQEQASWMEPFQKEINLLMMCQDQVVKLPPNATVLASSEKCPVGIFQVGEKMLGIQAHPEFNKAYDRYLMNMRRKKIGAKLVKTGISSLNQEVHRNIIRSWILKFIGLEG